MGQPSQKIPQGLVVWSAPGTPPEIIITHEADDDYTLWEWRPDMIKYGYTTGYAGVDGRSSKRKAVQRAKELIAISRKYGHATTRHHATKKKSPAQLQREIDEALAGTEIKPR